MKLLNILEYPDPGLKRTGYHVTDFGADFQAIVEQMFATRYGTENCAALAASSSNELPKMCSFLRESNSAMQ